MGKRRNVGDIVKLNDADGAEPYLGCIDALGAERGDQCPCCFSDSSHDQQCAEWPVINVLDEHKQPTGVRVFHVAECQMSDPA